METKVLVLVAVALLLVAAGVVAAQTEGSDTTGPDVPVGGGGGDDTTSTTDGGTTDDRNITRDRSGSDNTSWYERLMADDAQTPITPLGLDAAEQFDASNADGAADFDREIRTNTMAGTVTPAPGTGSGVRTVDADTVHVVAQFDADDPTVDPGGSGVVPGFVPLFGSSGPGNITARYDLTPCGSYMHPAGWENAHCYGVPSDQLDGFLNDGALRAAIHRDADWKMYPELRGRLRNGSTELLLDTYPDAGVSSDDLNRSFNTSFVPANGDGAFRTASVSSYGTARVIAENESVAWVEWRRPIRTTLAQSREHVGAVEMNGQNGSGGLGVTGDGVYVGIHDSGIDDNHRHFNGVDVTYSADWVDWGMPPEDEDGHGTHVAGTIAGNGSDGSGTVHTGIAPDANLVVARGLGPAGYALIAGRLMPAGRFARMANDAPDTMAAISNSWSGGSSSRASPVSRYDMNARSADKFALAFRDTLLVFANGNACASFRDSNRDPFNDGADCAKFVRQPALGKNVLSVGASTEDGAVSSLNNMLPPEDVRDLDNGRVKPEVLAPGEGITAPNATRQYQTMPGTSMSTPHVSGVVALIREKYPDYSANLIRSLLIATTSPVRNPNDWLAGYGEVNAHDAIFDNNYESDQFSYSGMIGEEQRHVRTFDVPEDAHRIDASLAWLDPDATAGGTEGFIFNRIDLKLDGPDSWHSDLDPKNVKKLTVEDPEPGEWRLLVTGTNVGRWHQGKALQPYNGSLRVVDHEPAVEVVLETEDMRAPRRAKKLDDNAIRVGRGGSGFTNVSLKIVGTGSVVSDVDVTVNATSAGGIGFCPVGSRITTFDAGDLSRAQEEERRICIGASPTASVGNKTVRVEIDSTNGVNSSDSTKVVEFPVFVTETNPPDAVKNVRSTTHTVDDYSTDTEFRFEWDRGKDNGGSGIDGYHYDLLRWPPDPSETPLKDTGELGGLYVDDPDSTVLEVSAPPNKCYDGPRRDRTCLNFSDGRSPDSLYWFYIRAQDKSKNFGNRTVIGPFGIDTTPPGFFDLRVGGLDDRGWPDLKDEKPDGAVYDVNGTETQVWWQTPGDKGGIDSYTYTVSDGTSVNDSGRLSQENAYYQDMGVWSVDSRINVSGLSPGENTVRVTAVDEAGNTRNATVTVCAGNETCRPVVHRDEARQNLEDDELTGVDLDEPESPLDGSAFERRLAEQLDCPGTRLCGDDRPGWAGLVDDEDLLVTVEGPDGEVQGRYFAKMEDGRVANVERVTDPAEVDQTVDVTTDAGTVKEIMDADDTMGAIGTAYDEGAVELSGNGLRNSLKYGAIETGYGAYDAASGALDAATKLVP